ncbi:hypothetical protein MGYG_06250 [Nannizzia gypsea CBS 118893]|uniref:HAD superfamily phosphatase n=1 Tax=Arthroderma gypseum (strain ATCC MYA-4604 / CBS 118893) TaxID=535722 RepID=E4UYR8_ARTGP|nr:hypothetical protein MGYG_06250 [Nannizzia gypsea CBS 118893]EFR03248.1 hypothetical protein MGYG_06250 [Nannizzia gypsea CBS 118893]
MRNPSLLIPHLTISTFLQLPEDLSYHLIDSVAPEAAGARPPTIRALVIDKDNTLTPPHKLTFPTAYYEKLKQLRTSESSPFNMHTNPDGILIVSNTAGSDPRSKRYEDDAKKLEEYLGKLDIKVFRAPGGGSAVKKPMSYAAVLEYLKSRGVVERADEVVVVGDRVGTDVLMASMMGSWSVWTRDGVTQDMKGREGQSYRGVLAGVERYLVRKLQRSGVKAALPKAWQHL